jgi:hypothetical protein
LSLKDKVDLFDLIARVLAGLNSRIHRVTRAEIVTHARARLAAMDREWQQTVPRAKPGTWVHKLAADPGKLDQ